LDESLVEKCKAEFQDRRGDRSQALKKASLNRADPDYHDMLTAKTQWKMKDLLPPVAKPLQTILIRSDAYLFKLGWVGVYLLHCILRDAPSCFFWHAKKTLQDMKDWFANAGIIEHEFVDISSFDTNVRGGATRLISMMMRRYGIPEDLIEYYLNDKMDFHTRTLHFAIMTFSGELFTWLGNGLFQVGRECLKYDIPHGWPMANSGDDIERAAGLPISPNWKLYEDVDTCIEKRYVSDTGEFTSFLCKNNILYKDPILLYKRLRGQLSRGKVDDIALGYFELFTNNYVLGDLIYTVMTEEQLQYVNATNYIMFNLKKFGYHGKLDWSKVHLDHGDQDLLTPDVVSTFISNLNDLLPSNFDTIMPNLLENTSNLAYILQEW